MCLKHTTKEPRPTSNKSNIKSRRDEAAAISSNTTIIKSSTQINKCKSGASKGMKTFANNGEPPMTGLMKQIMGTTTINVYVTIFLNFVILTAQPHK